MSGRLRPLLALNWKLQKGPAEARAWAKELLERLPENRGADLAVLAPFVSLPAVASVLAGSPVAYGSQDVSAEAKGAFTGEVAAAWLKELDCAYTVIGHSERREYHGESDQTAGRKVLAAQANGLTPILCVGEKLPTREAGEAVTFTLAQLERALQDVPVTSSKSLVVAYEPIWAIGTGRTATPDDAEQMGVAMRGFLKQRYGEATAAQVRLLYGGSVKPDNIAALCARQDVDGALVGGASLELDSTLKMLAALS
ncbi:MAG TPA: triose-phosphate isomerase [Deinococcales bacterium]|nr:triose-phosphate isomerase [Deinococcales bacterium]